MTTTTDKPKVQNAREFATHYDAFDNKQHAVNQIAAAFLGELQDHVAAHKCKTAKSYFGILDQLEQKWQALVKLQPDITAEGFKALVHQSSEPLLKEWAKHCKAKGKWFE